MALLGTRNRVVALGLAAAAMLGAPAAATVVDLPMTFTTPAGSFYPSRVIEFDLIYNTTDVPYWGQTDTVLPYEYYHAPAVTMMINGHSVSLSSSTLLVQNDVGHGYHDELIFTGSFGYYIDVYADMAGTTLSSVALPSLDQLKTATWRYDIQDGYGGYLSGNFNPFAAAPEPTTWMLMLGGFMAIGASLRDRTRKSLALVRT